MKLLKNEQEYRQWYIHELCQLPEDIGLIVDPADLEAEIITMKPDAFPCVACILNSANPNFPQQAHYIYRDEVMKWAAEMA